MARNQVSETDRALLRQAIDLGIACPREDDAFAVGAVIVAGDGQVLATGYSRESDPHIHAEEAAIGKLAPRDPRLRRATIYTSLEPCTARTSRPVTCTQHILDAGVARIVFAWREPDPLVACNGAERLRDAGRDVVEVSEFAGLVRALNPHMPGVHL
ncbi:dCMP deaminase [Amycolatopsis antarctica]|uniref:dCMP deaminase n=1 Tax=Amycolatopsis antarctica TaxID=1854586 RepID=A0A263CZ92_9PSEU|nr:deaminase [Amycolatopsis antarctica]OZM71279.1 dCMP deaminase [Amycolatopsis antarctica]